MKINIELADEKKIETLSSIALKSFLKYVAPHYAKNGIDEFSKYASAEKIKKRMHSGNLFYLANRGEDTVGMAETREPFHLAMLFIEESSQGKGVGRKLFERIVSDFQKKGEGNQIITVNASPNSTVIYQSLGFEATGELQEINGIEFLPMQYKMQ